MLMDAWARAALENNHVTWADFVGLDTIANSFLMREEPGEDAADTAGRSAREEELDRGNRPPHDDAPRSRREGGFR